VIAAAVAVAAAAAVSADVDIAAADAALASASIQPDVFQAATNIKKKHAHGDSRSDSY
jgi:hypothetical protein